MKATAGSPLLSAIEGEGRQLQARAEFFQKAIAHQTQVLENITKSIEAMRVQLEATNIALDSAREQYKIMLNGDR